MPPTIQGISVIICCYNSAKRLTETLNHLTVQEFEQPINWEVIIVNNASTDNTFDIAKHFRDKFEVFNHRLVIVDQPIPGLSYARDMGVALAKYKYIVFCDDDNWLDSKYLSNAYKIMESNPNIGALGGQSVASTDAEKLPDWFENVKNWYAVGMQSLQSGDVSNKYSIWGAGMVTKKELHLKCFPPSYPSYLTGRKGESLSAGEDTEFCLRLLLKNYMLYYDESLKLTHFISKHRITPSYRDGLQSGFKAAISKLLKYSHLCQMKDRNMIGKFSIFFRIFLGYLSTFFGRKSYQFESVKIAFYYLTNVSYFVDCDTKKVYSFYKNYHFTLENP